MTDKEGYCCLALDVRERVFLAWDTIVRAYLRRGHGVFLRQKQLQLKNTTFVRRVLGPSDHDREVPEVVFLRLSADARSGLAQQTLGLLLPEIEKQRQREKERVEGVWGERESASALLPANSSTLFLFPYHDNHLVTR